MAETNSADTNSAQDVNNQVPADSSDTGSQVENPASTPAGANPASESKSEDNRVPYTRFKEVIDERNTVLNELKDIKSRLDSRDASTQQVTAVDRVVQKFKGAGVNEDTAKMLADAAYEIAREQVESRVAPVERATHEREVSSWINDFSRSHNDFDKMQPKMYDVYSKLPEHTQQMVASDPKGLEMLYAYAKTLDLDGQLAEAKKAGAEEALTTRRGKVAASSASGSGSTPDVLPTLQQIEGMDNAAWEKVREKVLKNLDRLK